MDHHQTPPPSPPLPPPPWCGSCCGDAGVVTRSLCPCLPTIWRIFVHFRKHTRDSVTMCLAAQRGAANATSMLSETTLWQDPTVCAVVGHPGQDFCQIFSLFG